MSVLYDILHTYIAFFQAKTWADLFSDPKAWGLVGSLIILEGLLSSDNALVLAIMVKHLPLNQRKKALMYGMWGAYVFRFIAIGLGTTLIHYSWVKVFGALYLIGICVKFARERWFTPKKTEGDLDGDGEVDAGEKIAKGFLARYVGVFVATVCQLELMDISFSVDSILASLAVASNVAILLLGGCLGILMMRGVAQIFVTLIEKIPELEVTAYVLIFFVGIRMGISVINIEMPDMFFFVFLIASFVVTFIIHMFNVKKVTKKMDTIDKKVL